MKEDGSLSSKLHDVKAKLIHFFQCLLIARLQSEERQANDIYTIDKNEQEDRHRTLTILLQ